MCLNLNRKGKKLKKEKKNISGRFLQTPTKAVLVHAIWTKTLQRVINYKPCHNWILDTYNSPHSTCCYKRGNTWSLEVGPGFTFPFQSRWIHVVRWRPCRTPKVLISDVTVGPVLEFTHGTGKNNVVISRLGDCVYGNHKLEINQLESLFKVQTAVVREFLNFWIIGTTLIKESCITSFVYSQWRTMLEINAEN